MPNLNLGIEQIDVIEINEILAWAKYNSFS